MAAAPAPICTLHKLALAPHTVTKSSTSHDEFSAQNEWFLDKSHNLPRWCRRTAVSPCSPDWSTLPTQGAPCPHTFPPPLDPLHTPLSPCWPSCAQSSPAKTGQGTRRALKGKQGLEVAMELLKNKARKQNLLFQSPRQKTALEFSGETSNLDKSEALRTGWLQFSWLQGNQPG